MSEDLKRSKSWRMSWVLQNKIFNITTKRLPKELQLKSSNGSNLINSKAEKIILGKVESSSKSNTKDQQISSKDQQISSKDQQIEKLTNLLDQ